MHVKEHIASDLALSLRPSNAGIAALLLWFIALIFPFYGIINSIIGALTGSMVSFVLPALAYNLYYMRSASARANAPKQPPRCGLWWCGVGKDWAF